MCTMSMIGDFYGDKWKRFDQKDTYTVPAQFPAPYQVQPIPQISREEFDALRREVADMKELLKRAKAYDEKNGEPDCEVEDKVALLRKVAKLVGVDLSDILQ